MYESSCSVNTSKSRFAKPSQEVKNNHPCHPHLVFDASYSYFVRNEILWIQINYRELSSLIICSIMAKRHRLDSTSGFVDNRTSITNVFSTPSACLKLAEQYSEQRLANATRYRTAQAQDVYMITDTPWSYSDMSAVDVEMADVSCTPPRSNEHRYVSFPPLEISPTRIVSPKPHSMTVSYSPVVFRSATVRKLSTTGFSKRKSTPSRPVSWEARVQPRVISHISEILSECSNFLRNVEYELHNMSLAGKQMSGKLD